MWTPLEGATCGGCLQFTHILRISKLSSTNPVSATAAPLPPFFDRNLALSLAWLYAKIGQNQKITVVLYEN